MTTTRKIKILYCIDSLVRGGTELQLIGLIERLDRGKFSPYLLTIRPSVETILPDDCPHVFRHVPKIFSPGGGRSCWDISRFLRRKGIDIIHSFFPDSTIFATFAGMMAGTPVRLASFRDMGFWRSPLQDLVLKGVYRSQSGFLCNAHVVKEHYVSGFGLPPEKFEVIFNGIDGNALTWVEHSGPILDVGLVGNMTRKVKRTDLFLKAAALVHRSHPQVRWHIVGDGHLRSEMEKLAAEGGISEQTTFAGRISRVDQYLEKLPVAVLCSDSEGFSNAILEYMFKGCTPVVTDVGGNPEIVDHEINGLLVPADDPQALAGALLRLIENPEFCRTLAHKARRKVEDSFGWKKCVEAHEDYYERILSR